MTNTITEFAPKLSPEHAQSINFNGLYKADPEDFRQYPQSRSQYWDTSGKYHCTNWCFKPSVWRDGRVFMTDNYWGSYSDSMRYEITDENFDEMMAKFECVMEDRNDWQKTSIDEAKRYESCDVIYNVAEGSGGYTCGSTTWVRKNAQPSVAKDIAIARNKLSSAITDSLRIYDLNWSLRRIEKLLKQVDEEGVEYAPTAMKHEIAELIEKNANEPVKLADVYDMTEYLTNRCYCPGEIYEPNGFYYRIYADNFEVQHIGSAAEAEEGYHTEYYYYAPYDEIVAVYVNPDDTVEDAVRFDSTPNNISQCVQGVKVNDLKLDNLPSSWVNMDVEEIVDKAKRVKKAIDELADMFCK